MRFIILTLLSLVFSTSIFAEVRMIPLNKYRKQQNSNDPSVLFYVFARCGAINFNVADVSKNRKEIYERTTLVSETFSQMAVEIRQKLQPYDSSEVNQRKAVRSISTIANEYVEIMNDHYTKTGSYFTDWMMDDLSLCSAIYDSYMRD
jgi:hypothetical protein